MRSSKLAFSDSVERGSAMNLSTEILNKSHDQKLQIYLQKIKLLQDI